VGPRPWNYWLNIEMLSCAFRRGAGRGLFEIFFISPMILPQFVVTLAMYVIIASLGLVGHLLTFIFAYAVSGFPFVFLIMYAAF
jgi:ABC-type spermidine/putrescine transport system permease subunit II